MNIYYIKQCLGVHMHISRYIYMYECKKKKHISKQEFKNNDPYIFHEEG